MTPRPRHVGLNLVFLVPGATGGTETVARELIPALVAAAPEIRFTAFVNRETATAGDGPWGELIEAVTVPVRATNRVEWVRGEQQHLPRLAAGVGVDLLHSLANTGPAWGRFRRVVTVHDVIYRRFPETHGGLRAAGMRVLVPLAVRRADRVIADSRSTADDLVELLRTPPQKVDVVPLGVDSARRALPLDAARTRARFDLGERRTLLSLSAKRPHKNLPALISALALVASERRPVLVIPGYPTPHERELREHARTLGVDADLRLPGWISAEELEGLWSVADAFVFPSRYEGFGLPVLEAMARGVPVACSNAPGLAEVAVDAALLFEPDDEAAIAAAIERLLGDPAERQRLRGRGLERAREYTWERTARGTLASYERTVAGR